MISFDLHFALLALTGLTGLTLGRARADSFFDGLSSLLMLFWCLVLTYICTCEQRHVLN